jgi:hypothetical protein
MKWEDTGWVRQREFTGPAYKRVVGPLTLWLVSYGEDAWVIDVELPMGLEIRLNEDEYTLFTEKEARNIAEDFIGRMKHPIREKAMEALEK